MKKQILPLLCCIMVLGARAQYPPVTIPGSQVRTLTSNIVKGQEYELHILLPNGYTNSSKTYPVVYLMDSQWDFPLVKSIYGQQYYDGFVPELIIVGVTWGGKQPNPDSLRVRDYTPVKESRAVQSGGADSFLAFMRKELFPFIETNYRASAKQRTLMGCSLGGLLTLYTLFTQPDMFTGYVAASPAIGWANQSLSRYEASFAKSKRDDTLRLYCTAGDVELSGPACARFMDAFGKHKLPFVSSYSKMLDNTGHSGTKSETYSRGLQYVFERPSLAITPEQMSQYTGTYKLPDGQEVEVVSEGKQLALRFRNGNNYALHASAPGQFYTKAMMMELVFEPGNKKATGFQLQRYGRSDAVVRLK